jgi:hypothetical protein
MESVQDKVVANVDDGSHLRRVNDLKEGAKHSCGTHTTGDDGDHCD